MPGHIVSIEFFALNFFYAVSVFFLTSLVGKSTISDFQGDVIFFSV